MPKTPSLLRRAMQQRAMRQWDAALRKIDRTDLGELSDLSGRARRLRGQLDQFLNLADDRLALPRIGSTHFKRPDDSDWFWRPDSFRNAWAYSGEANVQTRSCLGDEMTVFHDCPASELTIRQMRNRRQQDLAPYALRMDVFAFQGSFLGLNLDLPPEAARDLTRRHLIRMQLSWDAESELEMFARLNIQHGPNCENIVREIPNSDRDAVVEFDLGYVDFNEARVEKLWLDLIFENPQMNSVTLRDLTFSRQPRAQM